MQEIDPPRVNLLDIVMRDEKENPGPSRSDPIITPFQFSLVPTSKKRSSNRKLGKSEIISSSPYKKDLEEAKNKRKLKIPTENKDKNRKKEKVMKRDVKGKGKGKGKGQSCKSTIRKIFQEQITESDSDATFTSDKSEDIPTCVNVTRPTGNDCVCFFCNGKFTEDQREEQWVQCFMCNGWVHSECAGYDSGCYVCDTTTTIAIRRTKCFFVVEIFSSGIGRTYDQYMFTINGSYTNDTNIEENIDIDQHSFMSLQGNLSQNIEADMQHSTPSTSTNMRPPSTPSSTSQDGIYGDQTRKKKKRKTNTSPELDKENQGVK